jgi:hypothetical protein
MLKFAPAAALFALAACSGPPAINEGNIAAPTAPAANSAAPGNGTAPATPAEAATYLPAPGTIRARAMALAVPPEAEALAQRITTAIRANPDWYRAYAAQHPQGELPWHANLGVTAEEYQRFQTLTNQISLREVGQVTLTVTSRPNGGLALSATGPAAALNGITLYPARDRVETALGSLTNRSAAVNTLTHSPTGPWRGVRWSNRGTGAPRQVSLSFGRRARGDMILFYDYGPTDAESVVLLYPAPAGAPAP